jgi:hypothetical protein
MRRSWCIGITERPRTTEISTFTLSRLEAMLRAPYILDLGLKGA